MDMENNYAASWDKIKTTHYRSRTETFRLVKQFEMTLKEASTIQSEGVHQLE